MERNQANNIPRCSGDRLEITPLKGSQELRTFGLPPLIATSSCLELSPLEPGSGERENYVCCVCECWSGGGGGGEGVARGFVNVTILYRIFIYT